ncbi:MAG: EndoU domain-containing protein [Scytolyngbya sp. HA4215-MV1]|jgi:hypothetical protein|nr:EndoU domain-containing protein [Scytolyngbya sp. HA4215-MV1]
MVNFSNNPLSKLAVALLGATVSLSLWSGNAAAQVRQSGTFQATQNCLASRAINGANPENVRLVVGQRYELVGFNSPARKYVLLKVPNATPNQRWVSASCGQVAISNSTPTPMPDRPQTPGSGFLPFFDQINNPVNVNVSPNHSKVDISPPPPLLKDFDRAILKTCGPIGSKVNANSIRQLLTRSPNLVKAAQQQVGGELLPGRSTESEFLDDLVAVWSKRSGFEHIFCGELESAQKIGGLHFVGRYLQLQEQGIGGRLPNNASKEEVIPGVVYTLGIVIRQGNRTFSDDLKGYPYVSDGQELFLAAIALLKAQGNAQGACIATVADRDSGKSYSAIFVKDRDAIVTFYPDATPKGKSCRP